MGSVSDGIRREWRHIAFILVLILIFCLIWIFRSVLLPFVIGLIFAYILLPFVHWIEKRLPVPGRRYKLANFLRISTILIVYLFIMGVLGLLVFYIVTIARESINNIQTDASNIIPNGLGAIKNWVKSLPFLSNPASQTGIDNYFQSASDALPGIITNFFTNSLKIIQASTSTIIGFLIMPIFMFFILKDWEKLRDSFYANLSPWLRKHTHGAFEIMQNVVVRYIRGQLILGLVVGVLSYIMLLSLGIKFALPLAIFSGITEMAPMIGPWIGGGLGVLVTLALSPDKWIWVALGYLIIQLLENTLLVPRIQGTHMEINPAFVILLTLLGAYFGGILGFVVVLPATMAIVKLSKYFKNCIEEEHRANLQTNGE